MHEPLREDTPPAADFISRVPQGFPRQGLAITKLLLYGIAYYVRGLFEGRHNMVILVYLHQ